MNAVRAGIARDTMRKPSILDIVNSKGQVKFQRAMATELSVNSICVKIETKIKGMSGIDEYQIEWKVPIVVSISPMGHVAAATDIQIRLSSLSRK